MSCIASSGKRVQHLSQSIIHSVQEWSGSWRKKFDSVAVSESIKSSMTNLSYTGLTVLVFDISHQISTLEKTTCCHCSILSSLMSLAPNTGLPYVLVCCSVYELRGTFWLSDFGFHRASRCHRRQSRSNPLRCIMRPNSSSALICCDSVFTCIFLCSFRHRFKTIDGTEMTDVEQTQKMIPFIMCEISLCQHVCELVFGVDVLDWSFWGPD